MFEAFKTFVMGVIVMMVVMFLLVDTGSASNTTLIEETPSVWSAGGKMMIEKAMGIQVSGDLVFVTFIEEGEWAEAEFQKDDIVVEGLNGTCKIVGHYYECPMSPKWNALQKE